MGSNLVAVTYTAKNTVISPDFLVWKFWGKEQFPHTFGQFAVLVVVCLNVLEMIVLTHIVEISLLTLFEFLLGSHAACNNRWEIFKTIVHPFTYINIQQDKIAVGFFGILLSQILHLQILAKPSIYLKAYV